jgi:hypothetical protein
VSEWIGWLGRLRRAVYARMEELSFRTGAATVAGVVAVAATAILLTLTQGGHHAAARAAQAGGAIPSRLLADPPIATFSPSARTGRHRASAAPDVHYVPQPTRTPTATPQASPSPSRPAPLRTFWTPPPDRTHTAPAAPSSPGFHWPWPTPSPSWQWNGPG